MPNYRETPISGTGYQRVRRIVIEHPLDGTPSVHFVEEKAYCLDGGKTVFEPCGSLNKVVEDLAEEIPLLDPLTGDRSGKSVTYEQVRVILTSAYFTLAAARDRPADVKPNVI